MPTAHRPTSTTYSGIARAAGWGLLALMITGATVTGTAALAGVV